MNYYPVRDLAILLWRGRILARCDQRRRIAVVAYGVYYARGLSQWSDGY